MADYDFYDYEEYWKERKYEDQSERIALCKLLRFIKEDRSLLADVGGGFGRLADLYAQKFKSCVIIEPSSKLISLGKKRLSGFENVVFRQDCLPSLKEKSECYDVILMVRVMHHFSDSGLVIKELSRILKPDGYLILEFANKCHFLAVLREILRGNWKFLNSLEPIDRRSTESIKKNKILFMGHHPRRMILDLKSNNFKIVKILSVSNFRSPLLKKIIPLKILLFLENITQEILSPFFFGPSIFVLAQKVN